MGPNPMTLLGPEIKSGDQAPGFSALGQDMAAVSLGDSQGKVRIVASVPSLGHWRVRRGDPAFEPTGIATPR